MATQQQINSAGVYVTDDIGIEVTDGLASRIMLGILPDGTYGLRVNGGALQLFDQYGQTIMSNGAFVGPMLDFIRSGIYNNMFVAGLNGVLPIGTSRDDPAGHTVNLPGWTVWASSGAGTATRVSDATWPGGAYVELDFAAIGSIASNNVVLTSDMAPVQPGSQLTIMGARAYNVPAGSSITPSWSLLFYDSSGAYISTSSQQVTAAGPSSSVMGPYITDTCLAPNNARYVRFELNVWETVSHSAATYFRLGFASTFPKLSFDNVFYDLTVGGNLNLTGNLNISGSVNTLSVGRARYIWPPSYSPGVAYASTLRLPVNGGSVWTHILAPTNFELYDLYLRNADAAGLHTAEWALYSVAGMSDTGTRVAQGTFSFTPGAASSVQSLATGGPITIPAGLHFLVIRNTSATVTFGITCSSIGQQGVGGNFCATQTLGSALPASIDLFTGWTRSYQTLVLEHRTNDS